MSELLLERILEYVKGIAITAGQLPDKPRTTPRQLPDNCRTRMPDKETQQSHVECGLQTDPATGLNKYGNKVIRNKVIREDAISLNTPLSPQK